MFIPILINGFAPSVGINIVQLLMGVCTSILVIPNEEEKPKKRRREFYPQCVRFVNS